MNNFFDKYKPDAVINAAATVGGIYANDVGTEQSLYLIILQFKIT